jgi:hypothetical protein
VEMRDILLLRYVDRLVTVYAQCAEGRDITLCKHHLLPRCARKTVPKTHNVNLDSTHKRLPNIPSLSHTHLQTRQLTTTAHTIPTLKAHSTNSQTHWLRSTLTISTTAKTCPTQPCPALAGPAPKTQSPRATSLLPSLLKPPFLGPKTTMSFSQSA